MQNVGSHSSVNQVPAREATPFGICEARGPAPSCGCRYYLWALISGIQLLDFQVSRGVCVCYECVAVVCVCVRVCVRAFFFCSVFCNRSPSSDTVTALHRRQAPCSYMQVTVAAPQSLASNDRKPRDQASQRGRVSAGEERT